MASKKPADRGQKNELPVECNCKFEFDAQNPQPYSFRKVMAILLILFLGMTASWLIVQKIGIDIYFYPINVGDWKHGNPYGHGELTLPDGTTYFGDQKDGNPHGHGEATRPGGYKYVGDWRDGKQQGHGERSWPDGDKYVGYWKDGKKHGHGEFTKLNGQTYVGDWRDGQPHGLGKWTLPDG